MYTCRLQQEDKACHKSFQNSSGVSHGTLSFKNLLATSGHRSNKLRRAGVRVACLHNLLSPLLKGFSASFHLTYCRLCARPNIFLWVQVWRILRPVWLHSDVPLSIRSLGNRGVQDRFRIQDDSEGAESRKRLLQKRSNPFLHQLRPDISSPRRRDTEMQHLTIGRREAKDLLLFHFLPFLFGKPFLGALKVRLFLLSLAHVCPRGTQSPELWLQLTRVPSKLFQVTTSLAIRLPLLKSFRLMPLNKSNSLLRLLDARISLAQLLLWKITCKT